MQTSYRATTLAVLCLLGGLAACGGGGHGGSGVSRLLTSITVLPGSVTVARGATQTLTALGAYSDGTFSDVTSSATWTSASTTVATAAANGLVTGVGAGQTTITATLSGVQGSSTVSVPVGSLKSLAIQPANPVLNLGASARVQLIATYQDNSTQDVTANATWSVANTSLASVAAGAQTFVTANALSGGATVLTADLSGLGASTVVLVSGSPVLSLALSPPAPVVAVGFPQQLGAVAVYADGSTQNVARGVTWSVSDASKAGVSTAGVLSGSTAGITTITASFGPLTASVTATVTTATLTALRVSPTNSTIAPGQVEDFSAYGDFSDGSTLDVTTAVVWSSSSTAIAPIDSFGTVSGVGTGATTIRATGPGAVTGSVTLNVDGTVKNYAERRVDYNYRDISLTGTFVAGGDDKAGAIPATLPGTNGGLSFTFYGTAFLSTQISCATNGFFVFGGSSTTTSPSFATLPNLVALDGYDLVSGVYAQIFGVPGSRQLVIQWDGSTYDPPPGAVQMQAVLYEGSNVIEFRWRNMNPVSSPSGLVGVGQSGARFTQHSTAKNYVSGQAIQFVPGP